MGNLSNLANLLEGGPAGAFIKDIFESAEACTQKGDEDTATKILDAAQDVLAEYKKIMIWTDVMEEKMNFMEEAEKIVPSLKPKSQKVESAREKKARKLIEDIMNNDKNT
jgi:hypothetical protein